MKRNFNPQSILFLSNNSLSSSNQPVQQLFPSNSNNMNSSNPIQVPSNSNLNNGNGNNTSSTTSNQHQQNPAPKGKVNTTFVKSKEEPGFQHKFVIDDFSFRITKFATPAVSIRFAANGSHWLMEVRPVLFTKTCGLGMLQQEKFVSFTVIAPNEPFRNDLISARFVLSAMDSNDETVAVLDEIDWTPLAFGRNYGFPRPLPHEYMVELGCMQHNDTLVLLLEAQFRSTYQTTLNGDAAIEEIGKNYVAGKIAELFNTKQLTDFRLVSKQGAEIEVHKAILSVNSKYFAALFSTEMRERNEGRVKFDDIETRVLKPMVYFMYHGRFPIAAEEMGQSVLIDILKAAERLQIDILKLRCERVLSTQLTVMNACTILITAEMHHAKILKDKALKFVAENRKRIVRTENSGWAILRREHEHLIDEIFVQEV